MLFARTLTILVAAALIAGGSPPVVAAPELATLTEVGWGNLSLVELAGLETLEDFADLTLDFASSDQGTVSAGVTDGFDDGLSSFTGTATATASYGAVGVFATATSDNSLFTINRAIGQAAFTDTMTISGGTTGEEDTITFTVDVTGTSSTSGFAGFVVTSVFFARVLDGVEDIDLTASFDENSFSYTSKPFTFHYDEPFDLSIGLGVQASVILTSSATGDFANTVTLTDAEVTGGSPFSVVAESGTVYPFSAAVPEPATLLLLLAGGAAILSRHREP